MRNTFFHFKQFTINQHRTTMKVTTDSCLFGAWVAEHLSNFTFQILNLIDIGTGTGLLSLMIAQKNAISIDGVEIDKDAATQAKENISASSWSDRINIIHADILQLDGNRKYDCIVSNPPFYEKEIISSTRKKNVAHHSHQLKLSELLFIIKERLSPEGYFFLLLPAKREEEIDQLLQQNLLFLHKRVFVRQSVDHTPFRIMVMGSHQKVDEVRTSELVITDHERNYTTEFKSLLKDYYLHL